MPDSPNALKSWVLASRPKTLVAGMSPVLIGAAVASRAGSLDWGVVFLCLAFSLAIQIGANFANDYFDYVKGADTSERIGPRRAAQSGWISLSSLKMGMTLTFISAALISLPLLARGGLWGSSIVALSILFAILYTGGSKPLGYLGLGEVLVFIFYGPVATLGTYYILTFKISPLAIFASIPPGLLSSAILIANNLRDEESDRKVAKKTIVVRFGNFFGKWAYTMAIGLSAIIPLLLSLTQAAPISWALPSLLLLAGYFPIKRAFGANEPRDLIPLLPVTALLLYFYTALFITAVLL